MANIAVGIDLGTSNSCVAVSRHGKVDVLPNAYGESTTASVVNLAEDGSITVGNAAKANIIHDPRNTVYSAKRLIGRYFFSDEVKKAQAVCSYEIVEGENHSVRIKVRDEVFSLPEIAAMVLRELKSIAESRLGQPATSAVITVPAYFNDNQRQATKDAAKIAGIEVLRILNEPTAAALAYGFGRGLNQRVAIYDLGGGTFDISVLEIGDDMFEVLATVGDTFLGGDDFDDRLIDLLADEFQAAEGINLRNDLFAFGKLKVAAENAKNALSMDDETQIRIPDVITGPDGNPLSIERTLTNAEFSSLVNDLMQRTFKVCDEALQQAGIIARDLDGVILVGGPTRLPLVRNGVREYFQQDPLQDVDPDEAVAMGAAIHAATLMNNEGDAILLDVTPLSLQIGVAGGLTEPVIERNTPVPIEQTRTFTTFKDHQEAVTIRVYQGESREASDNELLGQFEFTGFRTGRRDEVEIDVTFEIDPDGIVNVTARDRATSQEASTRISLSAGLSDNEMAEILDRDVANRVETADTDPLDAPKPVEPVGDDELVPLSHDEPDLDKATTPFEAPSPVAMPEAEVATPEPEGMPVAATEVELATPEVELATPAPEPEAVATPEVELATPEPEAVATPEVELATPEPEAVATPEVVMATAEPMLVATPEDELSSDMITAVDLGDPVEPIPETQGNATPAAPHDVAELDGGFTSQEGKEERIAETEGLSLLDSEEEIELGDPAGLFDEPRDLSNDGPDQE